MHNPCFYAPDLNLGFEFLIVDVDGVVLIVLGTSSKQAICHFNIQQVVQHLNFSLESDVYRCYESIYTVCKDSLMG